MLRYLGTNGSRHRQVGFEIASKPANRMLLDAHGTAWLIECMSFDVDEQGGFIGLEILDAG